MGSLFDVKINWGIFFGIGILILIFLPNISMLSFFALMISIHQFMLLFYSYGYVIPVRYWAGSLMCLQMLVGPSFAYNGLDQYQIEKYKMAIPEYDYFIYAIPAVILFIFGLHSSGRLKGERIDVVEVKKFVQNNSNLPYVFIVIGFLSSIVSSFFGSELSFVFYLIGSFKFIGVFMLLIGGLNLKLIPLVVVFGSIILSSLSSAMFHDLLTWLFFLLAVLAIKYKPSILTKALFAGGLVLMIVVIQQLKAIYRSTTGGLGEERGIEAFDQAYEESRSQGTLFNMSKIAGSNVRINQGFIVTHIMENVPAKVPFENGNELYQILESAFLPRIIAPNKLVAGDRHEFTKYTAMQIRLDTSMSLSAMGDAYVNFGVLGGCIFMFVLGWVFNVVLNGFQKFSRHFPIILLFTPLVFYYPIRPDTSLQTSLGHLVKSCFLLYIMIIFWKRDLSKNAVSGTVSRGLPAIQKVGLEG